MDRKKYEILKARKETLSTFKRVDENIWTIVYQGSYGLDELLDKGYSGLFKLVRFAQNFFHSKQVFINPFVRGGCSSFNTRTPENDVIFGRNFDYKDSLCIVIWTFPENGYRSMTVTTGSFMAYGKKWQRPEKKKNHIRAMVAPYCCMDGVNEKGLAAAILEIKAKSTKQKTGKKPIITPIAIRAILDKCKNVDEALELLKQYDMRDPLAVNYHYHFADADGNSAIVEYVDNKMHIIRQAYKGENQKLTNYFLTEGGDNRREMGRDRYKRIEDKLCECNHCMSEEDAMDLLGNCTLNYRHKYLRHMVITVWSSVYNLEKKTMKMCAGMNYDTMYEFSLDEPGKVKKIK